MHHDIPTPTCTPHHIRNSVYCHACYHTYIHHTPSYTIIHHHTPSYIIIHHTPSYTIIHHHTPSYIIIHHHTSSYIIIHHHTSSYIIIHHHTSSFIIIHHHTSSCTSPQELGPWCGAVVLREVLLSVGYSGSTHMYIGQQRVSKPLGELTGPASTHTEAGQTPVNPYETPLDKDDEAALDALDAHLLAQAKEQHLFGYVCMLLCMILCIA